ncbi:hypothetical protein Rsub_00837 [Raphidocelis subcapitata]|uniref:J domain-containing protein n=1 Tax=Raphidocelis subcapitata TaxID=307507 RepID=A0A2V0NTG8_9CHLO|nr:hypothetical protein Rsub_00837 [Raphidocelis subcapitata]|eukprot:GBF88125.1 hypothetical protein Rsub_00837 [Raphidocelis subcapitata]
MAQDGVAARLQVLLQRRAAAGAGASGDAGADGDEGGSDGAAAGAEGGAGERPAFAAAPAAAAGGGSLPPEVLRRLQQMRGRGPAGAAAAPAGAGLESGAGPPGAAAAGGGGDLATPEAFVQKLRELLQADGQAGGQVDGQAGGQGPLDAQAAPSGSGGAAAAAAPAAGLAERVALLRARRAEEAEADGDSDSSGDGFGAASEARGHRAHQGPGAAAGLAAQQGGASPAGSAPGPSAPLLDRALALAARSLACGAWRECRDNAAAAARLDPSSQAARQLSLIALVLECAAAPERASGDPSDPWRVLDLGLPPAQRAASGAPVQPRTAEAAARQFRRLAAAVHPDKCPGGAPWTAAAGAAFKALAAARDAALRQLDGGGGAWGGAAGDGCEGGWEGADSGGGGGDDDAAWWSAWGGDEDGAWSRAFPRTAPTADEEAEEAGPLWALPLGALRAEVARRQAAVLSPATEEERAAPASERQKRLRVARGVLSARLEREAAAAAEDGRDGDGSGGGGGSWDGGGFLPGDVWEPPGAGHADKRQRVGSQAGEAV